MNPARHPDLLLRALSALLTYPDAELRGGIPEIIAVVHSHRRLKAPLRQDLLALTKEIAEGDELEVQGRYVDLFDRGRRTSLDLFEHVHGDGRERGPAMLALRQKYLEGGMEPVSDDLPDHLPVLLEYLSCCKQSEVRETLAEIAPLLRRVGNALLHRHSHYAVVMTALLALAGEKGLDAAAPPPPEDDFDRTWQERPAFSAPRPNTVFTRGSGRT